MTSPEGGEEEKHGTMSRVVNACDYKTLCPQSHGIVFNARVQSNSSGRSSTRSSTSSKSSSESSTQSDSTVSVNSGPDSTLSSDVIEQILLQKIIAKEDEIKKAFQIIDIDQTLKITKGEFRRVIETFILPLTDEQFNVVLAKVPGITKVTVPYLEFLSMFLRPTSSLSAKWNNLRESRTRTLSQMECLLREKVHPTNGFHIEQDSQCCKSHELVVTQKGLTERTLCKTFCSQIQGLALLLPISQSQERAEGNPHAFLGDSEGFIALLLLHLMILGVLSAKGETSPS